MRESNVPYQHETSPFPALRVSTHSTARLAIQLHRGAGLRDGMHRVVLQLSARASASVSSLRAMSQLRKRKSIVSADLDAYTQGDPASGSQGPPTPAQLEAAPVSLRRSRRAAVSAALRLAEVSHGPLAAVASERDVETDPDTSVAVKPARRAKKQAAPVDDDSADGAAEAALMPAPSVVVAAPVRRGSSKKLARAASEIALGVEPDPAAEAEVAVVIRRRRGKQSAVSAAEAAASEAGTAQEGAEADVIPAKPPRAPRRKKAAAAPAPSDSAALVDAPPLPALTVERMPAAIAHLAAADPGATTCPVTPNLCQRPQPACTFTSAQSSHEPAYEEGSCVRPDRHSGHRGVSVTRYWLSACGHRIERCQTLAGRRLGVPC